MNKEKRIIKVRNMYLYSFHIEGLNEIQIDISLVGEKHRATEYEVKDIPRILQILKLYDFKDCFAE